MAITFARRSAFWIIANWGSLEILRAFWDFAVIFLPSYGLFILPRKRIANYCGKMIKEVLINSFPKIISKNRILIQTWDQGRVRQQTEVLTSKNFESKVQCSSKSKFCNMKNWILNNELILWLSPVTDYWAWILSSCFALTA